MNYEYKLFFYILYTIYNINIRIGYPLSLINISIINFIIDNLY